MKERLCRPHQEVIEFRHCLIHTYMMSFRVSRSIGINERYESVSEFAEKTWSMRKLERGKGVVQVLLQTIPMFRRAVRINMELIKGYVVRRKKSGDMDRTIAWLEENLQVSR